MHRTCKSRNSSTAAPSANQATRLSAWSSTSTRETPRSDPIRRRRDGRWPVHIRGSVQPNESRLNRTNPRSYQKNTHLWWFYVRGRRNDRRLISRACRRPAIHRNKTLIRLIAAPWLHRLIEVDRFQFPSLSMTKYFVSVFIKLLTKPLFKIAK